MTLDLRLVKKGRDEPLEGILQQGRVHAGLGNMHGEELKEWGWLPEQTAGLEGSVAKLDSLASGQKEAKGRILEMIEDLNRIAKIAFDGQAEIASKFNKDILLRARKSQPKQDPAS